MIYIKYYLPAMNAHGPFRDFIRILLSTTGQGCTMPAGCAI